MKGLNSVSTHIERAEGIPALWATFPFVMDLNSYVIIVISPLPKQTKTKPNKGFCAFRR